ncbi:histidine phosphatase family protein [Paenibacillus sp. FSL W7-1287]|uniref:histidine phosphatase family protein n=1 Tax=Paenibacillus sp. FSL W7-1287 TaxID=2954538 RepID=UPI0030F8C830
MMNKVTVYLVRHAIKERTIGDVPITSEGEIQAQRTAQYFSSMPIHTILASPLRRATETAQHISTSTNIEVNIDHRLRERANWGDLPGQTFEEFVEMWDRCTLEPDYIPPIGDSARQACERLSSLLADLVEAEVESSESGNDASDRSIVIVTHGGLITDYLANTFPESDLNRFHTHFITQQSQLVPECSITELVYEDGSFSLVRFAAVEHLN